MKAFAGILLLLTFAVIVLGAYTRLSDAGLGCPDWPGCYGKILGPQNAEEIEAARAAYPGNSFDRQKALTEMIHRLVAGSLGLLIFLVTLADYRRARRLGGKVSRILLILCPVVLVQGAFGAWTVTLQLLPQVVLTHLLGGFLILSLVYLYFLSVGGKGQVYKKRIRSLTTSAILVGGILVVAQIVLGGWVSANYAARACVDFPLCNGSWLPPEMDFATGFRFLQPPGPNYEGGVLPADARLAIHFAHRLNAFAVLVYWLLLFYFGRRNHFLRASAPLFLGLLFLQMALGITNILGDLPLMIAVAHNALAAILLLNVLRILVLFRDRPATISAREEVTINSIS